MDGQFAAGAGAAPEGDQVGDTRSRSLGLGRVVMVLFWAFGAWTTVAGVSDLLHVGDGPVGTAIVSLLAGVAYLVAALGITHNGRRMRVIGWAAMGVCTVGPLLVGLLGLGVPELAGTRSPWSAFGAYYWFVPLVLPVIGLVWLWWSNPRRIVELAEQVERPSHRHR